MPQDPGADRVLEALQELVGEGCGFVETEASVWIGRVLIRILLAPLEEPIGDAQMKMVVGVQGGAETMEKADGPEGSGWWSRWTCLSQGRLKGTEQNVEDGAGGPAPVMEERPEAFGHGEDPLADGHVGNDVVHKVSRRLSHALGVA